MDDNQPHRAELYVRSLAPSGTRETQEAIVKRLLDLERDGIVDEVDLTVWGEAVCLDGASSRVGIGTAITDRIRAFHEWCQDSRVSLDPFFTWSTVDASFVDEHYHRVVPPHRCLAIYSGESLQGVYPCSIDGTPRTLEDGLRLLERSGRQGAGPVAALEEVG